MTQKRLDLAIAKRYSTQLLAPIKYGENGVFFWFPGSGMTTTLSDIFGNKQILKQELGKLAENIEVISFQGHLAQNKTANSLLQEAGFSYESLKRNCLEKLSAGYELVFIISRIDNFKEQEKVSILKTFLRLNALNPRRVHILFHSFDNPWFQNTLIKYPEFLALANRTTFVPILDGKLLKAYIEQKAHLFEHPLSREEFNDITETYGGILQLTKEYLRSKKDTSSIELKLNVIYDALPETYKDTLSQEVLEKGSHLSEATKLDLQRLGVWDLKLFAKHKRTLKVNPQELVKRALTLPELSLWNYCQAHQGEFISKDKIMELLRPENVEDLSLWALDKAVSRYRKKLKLSGIDPSLLKTLKGRGYVWLT